MRQAGRAAARYGHFVSVHREGAREWLVARTIDSRAHAATAVESTPSARRAAARHGRSFSGVGVGGRLADDGARTRPSPPDGPSEGPFRPDSASHAAPSDLLERDDGDLHVRVGA